MAERKNVFQMLASDSEEEESTSGKNTKSGKTQAAAKPKGTEKQKPIREIPNPPPSKPLNSDPAATRGRGRGDSRGYRGYRARGEYRGGYRGEYRARGGPRERGTGAGYGGPRYYARGAERDYNVAPNRSELAVGDSHGYQGTSNRDHPYDRHSGTGMGRGMKKQGGGRHNWGTPGGDEYVEELPVSEEELKGVQGGTATGGTATGGTATGTEGEQENKYEGKKYDNKDEGKAEGKKWRKDKKDKKKEEEDKDKEEEDDAPNVSYAEYCETMKDKKLGHVTKEARAATAVKDKNLELQQEKKTAKKEQTTSANVGAADYKMGLSSERNDLLCFNRGDERKYPPRGEGRREGKPGDRRGKVPPEVKPQPPKAAFIFEEESFPSLD